MKLIHSSQFRSSSMEIGKRNILSNFLNMNAKDVVKKSTLNQRGQHQSKTKQTTQTAPLIPAETETYSRKARRIVREGVSSNIQTFLTAPVFRSAGQALTYHINDLFNVLNLA